MSESKAASGAGAVADAVAARAGAPAGIAVGNTGGVAPDAAGTTGAGGVPIEAGGAAGSSGIVGAVTMSVAAPTTEGVSVAPSFGHTSTPAGYCVRHRGQTGTT